MLYRGKNDSCALLGYCAASSGISLLDYSPLKMGPTVCPETPVRKYHYCLRNNPEERGSHLLLGGSLNSNNIAVCPEIHTKHIIHFVGRKWNL
jgi:hypothetical protein